MMNLRVSRTVLPAAIAAFLLAGPMSAPTLAQSAESSVQIAVVDTDRLFRETDEARAMQERLNARQREVQQQQEQRQQELQQKQQGLRNLVPESEQFVELRREILRLDAQNKFEAQYAVSQLQELSGQLSLDYFRKIQAAVATVAQEKGLDLVVRNFADDLPESARGRTPEQVQQLLQQQTLLYISPGIDITADVIAELNEQYAAGGGTPPAAKHGGQGAQGAGQ